MRLLLALAYRGAVLLTAAALLLAGVAAWQYRWPGSFRQAVLTAAAVTGSEGAAPRSGAIVPTQEREASAARR